jgi:2-C-methyl-D-erythritol 4-phosphate cytidylyltransferase
MGASVKKQYLQIGGEPILVHSVRALESSPLITEIVLVIPKEDRAVCTDILRNAGLGKKLRAMVEGGRERYHSTAKGLEAIEWPCDYVFIHDAARPFLDEASIRRLYAAVREGGAAVAGMPSKDTVRITDSSSTAVQTPDRSSVWIVQTPQVFPYELILEAHRRLLKEAESLKEKGIHITDDAMVAEQMMGAKIKMVEGSYRNIKVTTPEDLPLAEAMLRSGKPK